jgi:hypothetical protein
VLDEVADDVEVDVGFEEGYADFAQGFSDVLFSERALAAEGLEGALEFVCEVFKHGLDQCIGWAVNRDQRTGNIEQGTGDRDQKGRLVESMPLVRTKAWKRYGGGVRCGRLAEAGRCGVEVGACWRRDAAVD